jgi:hypothetical protein
VRSEHVKVLVFHCARIAGQVPIDLVIVVEHVHALLGELLATKVVGFQLDRGRETMVVAGIGEAVAAAAAD